MKGLHNTQLVLAAAATSSAATVTTNTACTDLVNQLSLPNTTIYSATVVPAGTNLSLPDNPATCAQPSQQVSADMCRVTLLTVTSSTSNISMEAWLPLDAGVWANEGNSRFLATGNGGLNGCIKYEDLNYGLSQGFATVGTNNGHNGTSGEPFYENPPVIRDYAYNSIVTEAVLGKQIVSQYYSSAEINKSYYIGCSTGGRQGWKQAQAFPGEHFDGILAGSPAFDLLALLYWTDNLFLLTGETTDPSFVSAAQWDLVYADVMARCDEPLDGVADGVIEDPDLCHYTWPSDSLLCDDDSEEGADTDDENCLTKAQANTVRGIYSPVFDTAHNSSTHPPPLIYPRLVPGVNSTASYFTGAAFPYPVDWFRYAVYSDPTWDPSTMQPSDYEYMLAHDADKFFGVNTWDPDLSGLRDAGVKVLHYHGLADSIISSDNSERWYDLVSDTMGLESGDLDAFYRFFRISGMDHCGGGEGMSRIGGQGTETGGTGFEPERNVLAALVAWVEDGREPETIEGTKVDDAGGVVGRRRHCRYPRRNVYDGSGDPDDADSWTCKMV